MMREPPATDGRIFSPVHLDEGRRRSTWSVNVDLPPEIEAEIRRYVEEDDPTSWTIVIHGALYIYRWQFRTKEELDAELREAIEAGIRSADEEGTIEVTPQFWEDLMQRGERNVDRIRALQAHGALGNLLLPKELYDFILERIASGACRTPTDVVCAAMPHLRSERARERQAQP
jgi:Arc/MetJ-type ribon-helix-helix transcriptional regulator